MRFFRSFSAVTLSLALTLLSPGIGGHQAFAQAMVRVRTGAASEGAPVRIGVIGRQTIQPLLGTAGSFRLGAGGLSPLNLTGDIKPVLSQEIGSPSSLPVEAAPPASINRFDASIPRTAMSLSDKSRPAGDGKTVLSGLTEAVARPTIPIAPAGAGTAGLRPASKDAKTSSERRDTDVELIVMFDGSKKVITKDMHMDLVDTRGLFGLRKFAGAQLAMSQEIERAGGSSLDAYDAKPIATYRRINAATIKVAASLADAFRRDMEAKNHKVFANERRELIRPIEDDPGFDPDDLPNAAALSMYETLQLSNMDKVHEVARARWGDHGLLSIIKRGVASLLGTKAPQPKIAVLDTGADTSHKLLKNVTAKNMTDGKNEDDNGHGSWVTSLVQWYAPWLKSVTHYKIFDQGGTTLDIILKALTAAANDGSIVMSNSWGGNDGDPSGPDSQLVRKLAEEGRIMVFAAGNEGYGGANTIGNPAIVHYRDPQTKALRVLAVAAADRNKKVTRFSSKGPGSRTTSRGEEWKDYPRKPDLAEQGENTEGAWPANLGGGRVDPELGSLRAISGTSMSTPKLAGTIAQLAAMFGVTEVGENLDKVVNAVMGTLTNEFGQPETHIGDGFSESWAAYQALRKTIKLDLPGNAARRIVAVAGQKAMADGEKDKAAGKAAAKAYTDAQRMLILGFLSLSSLVVGVLSWHYTGVLMNWLVSLF